MYDYGYATPAFGAGTRRIRTSVKGLGIAAVVLLALDAAMAALTVGLLGWRHSKLGQLLAGVSVDPDQAQRADQAARVAVGWFYIFTAATAVVFICWFWAARNNAEAYLPEHGTLGVGWSVGGWFVPMAGFVLPFIVARDVYRGTMAGRTAKPAGGGQIAGWWWAAYVAFWFTGVFAFMKAGAAHHAVARDQHLQELQSATVAGMVTLSIGTAAALLGIAYVAVVTKTQTSRFRHGFAQQDPYAYGTPYGYGIPPGGVQDAVPGRVQDAVPGDWPNPPR